MTKALMVAQSFGELMQFANMVAKSSMVPKEYQDRPENVLVACQWGAEVGLGPLQAMQNIAVINGKPSIYGDAALALVRGSGLCEYIHEEIVDGVAVCTVKRKGQYEREQVRKFSMEDAKRANLVGKTGPWTQYPERMLQMRARSWALRDVFPDVLKGIAVAEEAQDIPTDNPPKGGKSAPEIIESTAVEVVDALQIEAPAKYREKSNCKSCHAEIYWGKTENGKLNPYDWETETSHFTTCPNATQHSKKSVELPQLSAKDQLKAFLETEIYPLAKEMGMGQEQLNDSCKELVKVELKGLTMSKAKELLKDLQDMKEVAA